MPTTILELLQGFKVMSKVIVSDAAMEHERSLVCIGKEFFVKEQYGSDELLYRGASEADAVAALLGDTPAPVSTPKIGA